MYARQRETVVAMADRAAPRAAKPPDQRAGGRGEAATVTSWPCSLPYALVSNTHARIVACGNNHCSRFAQSAPSNLSVTSHNHESNATPRKFVLPSCQTRSMCNWLFHVFLSAASWTWTMALFNIARHTHFTIVFLCTHDMKLFVHKSNRLRLSFYYSIIMLSKISHVMYLYYFCCRSFRKGEAKATT